MPVMRRVITVLLHVITGDDRRREPGVDDKYIYIRTRSRRLDWRRQMRNAVYMRRWLVG